MTEDVMGVPVAYCALTPNGAIAYFDGSPTIMIGPVGNQIHDTPLYTAAQARALAEADVAREREACAALCESKAISEPYKHSGYFHFNDAVETCAESIRARGQGGGNERS